MKFCTKCGNELEEYQFVCPKCGNELEEIDKLKQEDVIPRQEIKAPQKTIIMNDNIKEKRKKKNKKVIILSISLVVVCLLAGGLGFSFTSLNNRYNELLYDFNTLNEQYFILTGEHTELENDYNNLFSNYNTLQNTYNTLQIAYDYICTTIKQSILPVQYSIFAEAVRRYYMDIYLEGLWELDEKEYWIAFTEFCRDIILHDSGQYNTFTEVSNAFSDALKYSSDTMYLADYIMSYTLDYCDTIDYWGLDELVGMDNLTIIDIVIQQCIDEIDYEYDSDITLGQYYFEWDYIKFPIETAFRTMGDCEDQAILTAAYLESCGLETAIAISHDPAHPTEGAFYHGSLLVHIEDTDAYHNLYPSTNLWHLSDIDPYEGYTWAWLDTTWDVSFGSTPSWLSDYGGSIGLDIMTIAFCNVDGTIGENIGLTCVMST